MEQRELPTEEKQDKGFTLVELLIVIVILGILATVTVFAVRGITDNAKASTCKTELAEVQTALEAYYTQEDAATPYASISIADLSSFFRDSTTLKGTYTWNTSGTVDVVSWDGAGVTDCDSIS